MRLGWLSGGRSLLRFLLFAVAGRVKGAAAGGPATVGAEVQSAVPSYKVPAIRHKTTIVEVLIAGSAAMGRAVTASVRCFCSSLRTPQLRSADNWRWANYWLRTNDLRSKARMAVSMLVSSVLSLRTPQLRIVDNQAGTNYWSAPTKFEPGCLGRWAVSSYKGPAIRRKTAIVGGCGQILGVHLGDFVSLLCTQCLSVFGDGGVAVAECRLQSSVNVEVDVGVNIVAHLLHRHR